MMRLIQRCAAMIRHQLAFMNSSQIKQAPLTHHGGQEYLSQAEVQAAFDELLQRLHRLDITPEQLPRLEKMAHELMTFSLGRFLIQHKGLSGYWTHYIISGHDLRQVQAPLERFLLKRAPLTIATRERFGIFQDQLLKYLRPGFRVASIPCGLMADLLTLPLDTSLTNLHFFGYDLDASQFKYAEELAKQKACQVPYQLLKRDAWHLNEYAYFDLICSNGLNIYEADNERVIALYQQFCQALKPGGKFITSAITHPPGQEQASEWDMDKIDFFDLEKQVALFQFVIDAKWMHYRSSAQTCQQLQQAGFDDVAVLWDKQAIFPTFVASKPLHA